MAGRLQVGVVAGETTGTVFHSIPGVVAGIPRERRSERVEEIVQCPAHEHIVVRAEHEGDNNSGQTNTCRVTRREGGTQSQRRLHGNYTICGEEVVHFTS